MSHQIEDLMDRLRGFHKGQIKTSLGELRHAYDLLVLKLLALLQDSDPSLAADIAASREPVWAILSDRARFSSI